MLSNTLQLSMGFCPLGADRWLSNQYMFQKGLIFNFLLFKGSEVGSPEFIIFTLWERKPGPKEEGFLVQMPSDYRCSNQNPGVFNTNTSKGKPTTVSEKEESFLKAFGVGAHVWVPFQPLGSYPSFPCSLRVQWELNCLWRKVGGSSGCWPAGNWAKGTRERLSGARTLGTCLLTFCSTLTTSN